MSFSDFSFWPTVACFCCWKSWNSMYNPRAVILSRSCIDDNDTCFINNLNRARIYDKTYQSALAAPALVLHFHSCEIVICDAIRLYYLYGWWHFSGHFIEVESQIKN
ncbi:hypothetical protein T09_12115 [Trichinella sp. T9]|nr:hypothetical protein T09_12115 [Trichinella sp. T9]